MTERSENQAEGLTAGGAPAQRGGTRSPNVGSSSTPTPWTFPERDSDPASELWLPEMDGERPGVIVVGDLWARAGQGVPAALGPELASKGFVAISATPTQGRDTQGFSKATLKDREADLERAVTALFERMVAAGKVDIRKIAVVGHGIGGAVAVAEAARDSRVGAVVAVGAPRGPRAYFDRTAIDAWNAGGTTKLQDPNDGTIHAMGPRLHDDWRAREAELDHSNGARKTQAPVLWVHGTEDKIVNVDESRRAYWKHPEAGRRARLIEVAGTGHDFGVPGEVPSTLPAPAKKLAETIAEFLEGVFKS